MSIDIGFVCVGEVFLLSRSTLAVFRRATAFLLALPQSFGPTAGGVGNFVVVVVVVWCDSSHLSFSSVSFFFRLNTGSGIPDLCFSFILYELFRLVELLCLLTLSDNTDARRFVVTHDLSTLGIGKAFLFVFFYEELKNSTSCTATTLIMIDLIALKNVHIYLTF